MKQLLKGFARKIAPNTFETIQAIRARRHIARLQQQWGLAPLTARFVDAYGLTVRGGPFTGMRFTAEPTWCNVVSKLLGCYEGELNLVWERILATRFDSVVDVGCADGYFAVGFARCQPDASVWGYDIDPACRRVTRKMAQENGVADRVKIRGRCSTRELRQILIGRWLVLSDCEGYEATLIDPKQVPALAHATLVVELHDQWAPGVFETLLGRLTPTHQCTRIENEPRQPADYPELAIFPVADANRLLREVRPPGNNWLVATPLADG